MPWAIVGKPQAGHGGLLTNLKNDRLNHLDSESDTCRYRTQMEAYFSSARMTQSW